MSEERTLPIRVIAQRRWQRVVAEDQGRDVSHLSFAPMPMRIGPAGEVRMAGIGGVATEPEYRRAGLAGRVFARAMEEIGEAGYSCVGLYTGTEIVAHRLYRRFGFVDTSVHTVAAKVLDPGRFVVNWLASLLRAGELQEWRCALEVRLSQGSHAQVGNPSLHSGQALRHGASVFVRIDCGEARLLEGRPERVNLVVTVSGVALGQLFLGAISVAYAEAAKLVEWEGEEAHWRRLAGAIESGRKVVKEG